ncbi:hypothetical protein [Halorussus halobius]|uniref:hypothetical protein n=1 Tax=Halorussus halobius TaxID=1710537 RepID=UPI0034A5183C
MADADRSGRGTDGSRIEALRRARERRPWTDDLAVECASEPTAFKDELPACAACPAPCEEDEVCATAVAKSEALFEEMGREQAYHLVETAMKRLRSRDEAEYRTADRERPNAFLALAGDGAVGTDPTDESRGRESEPADDEHGDNR